MKRIAAYAMAVVLAAGAPLAAQGITDSGNPAKLTVTTAVAGSEPTPVVITGVQYRAKTTRRAGAQKITGRISSNMPPGVSLIIELAPTTGATSAGPVTLSTTARDLVTNITNTTNEWRDITYTLQATVAAGVVAAGSRTVTLTITNWP